MDNNILNLWLKHWTKTGLEFKILINLAEDFAQFKMNFPYYAVFHVVHSVSNCFAIEIKYTDFLFHYIKDEETDEMILSTDIKEEWLSVAQKIGRVFRVPNKKNDLSTFEIPDFILYCHSNHSHFVKQGFCLHSGEKPSKNLVIFSLEIAPFSVFYQYYENHYFAKILDEKTAIFRGNNYYDNFKMNIMVNKEKQYAVIWFPKCGCSTITKLFCMTNSIVLEKEKQKSLVFYLPKWRYNHYLENIEYIQFVRNPYYRFISTFIDKHVFKNDPIYLCLEGFQKYTRMYDNDNIANLCEYLRLPSGRYISEHYISMSSSIVFDENIKCKTVQIESGILSSLFGFLRKYHAGLLWKHFANCYENCLHHNDTLIEPDSSLKTKTSKELEILRNSSGKVNYNAFLDDELKRQIFSLYSEDFNRYGYSK
jgi:hypothetical protein